MARENLHTENTYLVTWTVEPGENGLRLDHFLKEKYKYLSRERLQKSVKEGKVTLNHESTKSSRILRTGDKVYVLSVRGVEPTVDMNYKVLFEDDTLIVLDKPGNLPVHPVGRFFFNTLLTQLRIVNSNEVDQSKDFYLVHRIDRETSGILAMGKTKEAAASLVEQFAQRETEKEYLAIVKGRMEKDHYEVTCPLGRDPHSEIRLKMACVEMDASGKPKYLQPDEVLSAKTSFEVLRRAGNYTLVLCKPHTGRQHQIRVHLLHLGHPIVADKLYGVPEEVFLRSIKETLNIEVEPGITLTRHGLHAHKLRFRHPKSGERLEFVCDLPEELASFLTKVERLQ
jgi:RluA family pseudouridine synthase